MEVRIRATGQVMHEREFRDWLRLNNGPSYNLLTEEVMELLGVDPVFEGARPSGGTVYQHPIRDGVINVAGKWFTHFILGPVFNNVEEEMEYKAAKDAERSAIMRETRNNRLAATDWTQLADSPVDRVAWAKYRQELRNVPLQDGFPWNVEWPVKP